MAEGTTEIAAPKKHSASNLAGIIKQGYLLKSFNMHSSHLSKVFLIIVP
jgi:hypothetical protein